MPINQDKVVVVTYDATDDVFVVQPDPVEIPFGTHKLYFALQTVLGDEALFESIESQATNTHAEPVAGCRQLSVVTLDNDQPGTQVVTYDVTITHQGQTHLHDPTVILKPPPPGGF